MNKAHTLAKLLEERSINPENPHPYVAGYLQAMLQDMVYQIPGVDKYLEQKINRLEKEPK